jgi:translation elongation factor P/translation initiation factor 5A
MKPKFDLRQATYEEARAMAYCYRDGDKAVFLDRKDQVIETFDTMGEAIAYAQKHLHLIDRTLYETK